MTTLKVYFCSAIFSFAVAAPALAADPWTGTWKEDVSKDKSSLTVSYTAKGAGFHFSNGSTIQYDFACDGKVYPTYSTQSMKCTMAPGGAIDWTTMVNGKVTNDQHRSFSADGKTMTMDETIHLEDGSTTKEVLTRIRKSGTTGLVGEWANSKIAYTDPDLLTVSVKAGVYHFQHEHDTSFLNIKLDGTDTAPTGKDIPPGVTESYKAISPNKVVTVTKLNGKVMSEGTMTISPDGKTVTMETWIPGKESQKSSSLYVKQ